MKKYGLIGRDISYSLSPFIHNFLIYEYNLDASYELIDIDCIKKIDFSKYDGLNVTTPYKQEVLSYINDKSKLGIVNTLKNNYGFNTDIKAFDKFYKKYIRGVKAVGILGNSATAQMLKAYFKEEKVDLYIFSRTEGISYEEILNYDLDFIINTTPLGQGKYEDLTPLNNSTLKKLNLKYLLDFNYNPINTKLMIEAKKNKIKTFSGLEILILQAVYSFEIFTGIKVKDFYIKELILLCNMKLSNNTILYGMPLSGKSRIYKNLTNKENVYDLDLEIEKNIKMKIYDYVNKKGIESFRELENDMAKKLLEIPNSLIIVGGGFFTNLENLNLIKNVNLIYYKLSLKKLLFNYSNSHKVRPLIKCENDLKKIYDNRKCLYNSIYNLNYTKGKEIVEILNLYKENNLL